MFNMINSCFKINTSNTPLIVCVYSYLNTLTHQHTSYIIWALRFVMDYIKNTTVPVFFSNIQLLLNLIKIKLQSYVCVTFLMYIWNHFNNNMPNKHHFILFCFCNPSIFEIKSSRYIKYSILVRLLIFDAHKYFY